MMFLTQKRLFSYLLPCFSPQTPTTLIIPSSHHLLSSFLNFSTSKSPNPSPKSHFMVEYLTNSLGFSPDEAIKASKHLTHLKSPSKPESVVHFLNQCGMSETQIRKLIFRQPRLLCSSVEKTLKPKLKALQEMGFSESELIQLVSENTAALRIRDLQPKIEFWRGLLRTNKNLLNALRKDCYLLTSSLDKKIMPNLSFLRECGIPEDLIALVILKNPWLITRSLNSIKTLVKRVDELGFCRGSRMFWYGLTSVYFVSKSMFDAKLELLRSFGWTEAEVLSAVRSVPYLLTLSEKNLRSTMDFLVKGAGCEPSYIVLHPVILCYSLERRMIPRHCVLNLLMEKGLLKRDFKLLGAIVMVNKKFVDKFITSHKEEVPELHEVYVAACARGAPM